MNLEIKATSKNSNHFILPWSSIRINLQPNDNPWEPTVFVELFNEEQVIATYGPVRIQHGGSLELLNINPLFFTASPH